MATENELLIKIRADSDKAIKEIKALKEQVDKLSKTSNKSAKDVDSLSKSFGTLNKSLIGITASLVSFQAITGAVNKMAELEQGMVEVAKTTGLTGTELKGLSNSLDTLASELSGISIGELQNIAGIAGQLGIQGTENILSFTEAVGKIAVATDLTADEAAESFAILSNIMKEPISNTERLGSVVNELSNATTATAKDIVDFTKRIAAATEQIGLSSDETLALSATLKDVGGTAESSGSAISRVFGLMTSDVAGFAEASRVSMAEFKATIERDPIEALKLFLVELNKLDKYAQEAVLEKLGLGGVETKRTVQLLSGSVDLLNKNLATAKTEYAENTSLQKEYETASGSLQAKLSDVTDEVNLLYKRLGEELSVELKNATEFTVQFIKSLDKDDVKSFATALITLVESMITLGKVAYSLNDALAPDKLFGKDVGFIDVVAGKFATLMKQIDLYFFSAGRAEEANLKLTESLDKTSEANTKLISSGDATIAGIDNQKKATLDLIEVMTSKVIALNKEREELIKYGKSTKAHDTAIEELSISIGTLSNGYSDLTVKQESLTKANEETTKSTEKQKTGLEALTKVQQESLEKTKENLSKRLNASKDTLGKLLSDEKAHKDELAKLEAELHGIRQSYANKRAALDLSVESQIANIYAKGLDDYQAYKDAQQRADVVYAQAKKAIEDGNIELAKTYLSEYNSLVAQGAGDEIIVNEQVRATKKQTADEAKKDLLAGKALMEQVYNAEEQNEIALHNQKIADKKAEIELVKIQIEAQKALVTEIAKIVEMATGAKFDMDFTAVNTALANLDAKLAETANKERDAKIKVTADDQALNNLESDVEKTKLEASLDVDTKTGFTSFKKFKDGVEVPLTAPVDIVTDETDYGNAKIKIETTQIIAPVSTDTSEAMSNNERMRAELSRPLPTLHQTIVQHIVQANATGGNVGIGKFATGGGYKKRRGKIPGHDLSGKDDVPSLLTRGEFVQNVKAVDYYGEAFMHAINQRAIPKEALRLADGGEVDSGSSKNVNLSLMMPDNKTSFNMQTDEQIAIALERYIRKYQ